MINNSLHPWTLDPDEAIRLQEDLRHRLVLEWDGRMVNTVGGVAVNEIDGSVQAAIAVLHYPHLTPVAVIHRRSPAGVSIYSRSAHLPCGSCHIECLGKAWRINQIYCWYRLTALLTPVGWVWLLIWGCG